MKKIFGILMIAAIIGSASLLANEQNDKSSLNTNKNINSQSFKGPNFIDKNNNDICDNRNTNSRSHYSHFVDNNNDGICDNRNNRHSKRHGKEKVQKCKDRGNSNGRGRI
jgi:hypothetical protein